MKRRWKVLIGLILLIAGLAVLNAFAANRETEPARVTVEGALILELPGGSLQVLDLQPEAASGGADVEPGPPIVLIHGYTGSIEWWQDVIPMLAENHRVIAIDLLGHGGSAKPSSGYSIPTQADLIAQVLAELEVEGAVLVGHSLGGSVAVAVAERASELVDRLVIVDMAPEADGYGDLDLKSRISRLPVLGQAIKRLAPDALIRNGLEQGFAPGFPVPDFAVEGVRSMTYPPYHDWPDANRAFTSEKPLNERIEGIFMPLLVIFGDEDRIFDARASLSAYAALPGAQTELMEGVGHTPMLESPEAFVELLEAFAALSEPTPAEEAEADKTASEESAAEESAPARPARPTPRTAPPRTRTERPPASKQRARSAKRRGAGATSRP